jgi:hypothetical protein
MKHLKVDIDGTICTNTNGDYSKAEPFKDRIDYFNELYDLGNEIHYWTARGSSSGLDWYDLTVSQLNSWGCKYTSLSLSKPSYDLWIDDKALNIHTIFPGSANGRPSDFGSEDVGSILNITRRKFLGLF